MATPDRLNFLVCGPADTDVARAVVRMLTDAGHAVEQRETWPHVDAALAQRLPDLVFVDQRLTGPGGESTLEHLAATVGSVVELSHARYNDLVFEPREGIYGTVTADRTRDFVLLLGLEIQARDNRAARTAADTADLRSPAAGAAGSASAASTPAEARGSRHTGDLGPAPAGTRPDAPGRGSLQQP